MIEKYDYKESMFLFCDTLVDKSNVKKFYDSKSDISHFLRFCIEEFHNPELLEYIEMQ